MNIGIVPAQNLMGMANVAEAYGPKVAGYATLLEAQAVTPIPFLVPGAFGIPAAVAGGIGEEDLRAAFAQLVHGRNKPTLLMARSSHRQEKSGENESPMFPYFPPLWGTRQLQRSLHTGNPENSFQDFRRIVEGMRQDPDMGILASANVAGVIHEIGARQLLGGELVSFVASTHSPTKPSQIDINVVQGLGTRAVAVDSDAIVIRADRKTGNIFLIDDIMTKIREIEGGSEAEPTNDYYRQRAIDFYDLKSRQIVSLDWSALFQHRAKILIEMDREDNPKLPFEIRTHNIHLKPFGRNEQLMSLIGILRYFSERYGPSQIEGAFPDRYTDVPFLYQYLALPEMPNEARPLKPFKPHLYSREVMGVGTFEGSLVFAHTIMGSNEIRALDKRFADTGYILVAPRHTRTLMMSTPHCRCRLSCEIEMASSHAFTLMADRIAKNPKVGFVFGMAAQIEKKREKGGWYIGGIAATEKGEDYSLFPKACLDSNGEELVVEILP